jgi:inosine-uridine nucleoside N-ribohydrolase
MDIQKKAWILDTDLGWDPDDIIALLCLIKYIQKSNDKLAIITSNETINNNRAYIIKNIIDELIPDNSINISYGIFNKSKYDNLLSNSLKYHQNSGKHIIDISGIISFMDNCKKDSYFITWIGIGSMTNLAYLLKSNIRPDYVIQMGGTLYDESEFNINLDILSCKYILENWNNPDTLEFITLDTTGYNLLWLISHQEENNKFKRLSSYFQKILSNKYPYVLKIILENINCDTNIGYNGSSSLHDPLTIMYAIDRSILKTHNANILCNSIGRWKYNIDDIDNIIKLNSNNIFWNLWWKNIPKSLDYLKNINCKISIGPLSNYEIKNFHNKLIDLLNN